MNKGEHMYNYSIALKNIAKLYRGLFRVLFRVILGIVFLSSTLFTPHVFSATASLEEQELVLSQAELAQALAPIALYPDTLLTHILIASTYPIEVIQAERWLSKNSQGSSGKLTTDQLTTQAEQKGWDASIQVLLAFPQVMSKLSEDLSWMQNIGDAFLQDEARVLASIQTLRHQAEQAGSLENMDNVEVIKEQQIIIIEPAQPEVIYVPYYDTRVVYGHWGWSHYPPVYWRNPHHYAAHYGHFYWGHGIHIRSHFYVSSFHWKKRHVVVHHSNYSNRHGYHSRKKMVTSHSAKRWSHKPQHRRGVAYSNGRLKQKYYGSRQSVRSTNTYKNKAHSNKGYKNTVIRNNKVVKNTNTRSTNARSSNAQSNVAKRSNVKSHSVKGNKQSKHSKKTTVVKSNQHSKNQNANKYQASNQGKHKTTYKTKKQQGNKQYKSNEKRTVPVSNKGNSSSKMVSKKHAKSQQKRHGGNSSQSIKRSSKQSTKQSGKQSRNQTARVNKQHQSRQQKSRR